MNPPFLWGVATSAYQAEGGYNGPGEPQTNWAAAESSGDVARVGKAADFWIRYADDFDLCRGLGLTGFRLGLEWSRIEPTPGAFDLAALDHYAAILASCLEHGLEPVVTLHHFVHPAWLGPDAWLDPATPARFARFVRTAVAHVNDRLPRPIHWFITINEPNMLVLNSYLGRQFPAAARSGFGTMMRAYNELLRAHVLAYNALHDLYEERAWLTPAVTFNNYCSDLYWSDKLLLDLVCVRERGVSADAVGADIRARAVAFERAFDEARLPLHRDLAFWAGSLVKRLSNALGHRRFHADGFATFIETLYASPRARVLDYIGIDYYDPFTAHALRFPVWSDHEFKSRSFRAWVLASVTSKWWDWRVLPRGLAFFCHHYAQDYGRSVLIAENGMAVRRKVHANRAPVRRDGMTRSLFLKLHVHEVKKLVAEGVPVVGYLHWSLFDNYEWGTYTPRFGLYSLDFPDRLDRRVEDPSGDRPSETYGALIREG